MPGRGSCDQPPAAAARQVIRAAARWRAEHARLVIAIDGHGAAGKSTIADLVAQATGAALVRTDDFFRQAAGPAPARDPARTGAGMGIGRYYDWPRLRAEAIEPLRAGRAASFRQFDWDHGGVPDGGAAGGTITVLPGSLIVVEGVSSAAPALSDLVDRAVFVETPAGERTRRLRTRVSPEEWDDDWLAAEQAYFRLARPPSSFDLVVSGAGAAGGEKVTCC
jgi:uridine kinase